MVPKSDFVPNFGTPSPVVGSILAPKSDFVPNFDSKKWFCAKSIVIGEVARMAIAVLGSKYGTNFRTLPF